MCNTPYKMKKHNIAYFLSDLRMTKFLHKGTPHLPEADIHTSTVLPELFLQPTYHNRNNHCLNTYNKKVSLPPLLLSFSHLKFFH